MKNAKKKVKTRAIKENLTAYLFLSQDCEKKSVNKILL